MRSHRLLFSLGWLLLAAGCATGGKRYQVNVGNGRAELPPIRNVELDLDDKRVRQFDQIAPQKTAGTKPRGGKLPQTISLRWTDAEGIRHQKTLTVNGDIDPEFRGQLLVHISPDNRAELKALPSTGEEISPIPWNAPESWEGSISVPGFGE
jgi:hypothetical protein